MMTEWFLHNIRILNPFHIASSSWSKSTIRQCSLIHLKICKNWKFMEICQRIQDLSCNNINLFTNVIHSVVETSRNNTTNKWLLWNNNAFWHVQERVPTCTNLTSGVDKCVQFTNGWLLLAVKWHIEFFSMYIVNIYHNTRCRINKKFRKFSEKLKRYTDREVAKPTMYFVWLY